MDANNIESIKGTALSVFQKNRTLVIVIVVFVVLLGWVYISSSLKVRNVESAVAEKQMDIVKKSEERQTEIVKQSLEIFCTPLAWAVRREMIDGNMAQVDQYVSDLVKQKGFEQIVVAKENGKVAVASDRKNLGADFSSLYASNYLTSDKITVENKGQGKWLLVIPVMGLSARLGTIAIDYQVPADAPTPAPMLN
ncbi:MAG: hypothetical protein ACOH1I_11095 [Gallionellaceae bacterium]